MLWYNVELSKFHRLFYPQVPVVLTVESGGRIGGMPAIWCMPISFSPPMVGVSVNPEHDTYRKIVDARAFAVNWLDFSFAEKVARLGERSGKKYPDKLAAVNFTTRRGMKTTLPIIQEASAALECVVHDSHRTGTHELIIGEVLAAQASAGFGDYWDFEKYNPLLYAGTVEGRRKSWFFISGRGERSLIPFAAQTEQSSP